MGERKRRKLGPGDPDYRPARGYSWPPFEEGNTVALLHGADSERSLAPVAEFYEAAVVEAAPWTARDAFTLARRAWAYAEARCELYRRWFAERGLFGEDGEPLPGLERWERAEAAARTSREKLGLDPASLAKLLSSLASVAVAGGDDDGLAQLKAEGAAIVAARREALTGGDSE
jgi:hypothetical protein